jgi:hypothetical protein
VGVALALVALGSAAFIFFGFDTEFAKTTISCGALASEARPETRPAGPTREEVEYVELTGNYAAVEAYRAEIVDYLEAKACGSTARDRLWKYGLVAVAAWTAAGVSLRSAFRRKPRIKTPTPAK